VSDGLLLRRGVAKCKAARLAAGMPVAILSDARFSDIFKLNKRILARVDFRISANYQWK
jgi:hypothetical protein